MFPSILPSYWSAIQTRTVYPSRDVADGFLLSVGIFCMRWILFCPILIRCLSPGTLSADENLVTYTSTPLNLAISSSPKVGFIRLSPSSTGIHFTNQLTGDPFLTDAVAHNGSGVTLGDVNNDGWVDVYLCSLQGPNQLYLNQGNWTFVTKQIGPAACEGQRSTAATLVDVDGDTDLDLLVNGIAAGTRLFLNDGEGNFQESTQAGLSQTSSPTSMALADIDGDGDLDLYCAQYIDVMHIADPTTDYKLSSRNGQYIVTHVNGEPTTTPRLSNRFIVSKTGRLRELPETDALYLNDGGGRFKSIQFTKGTFNNAEGNPVQPPRDWSLAVMFRDLNQDGSPDIYVCTDNATPDRIWINNGNGTFNALERTKIRHTSRSSMGLDIADINRDGIDDIFVVDMFARNHKKRLMQLAKQHSSPAVVQHPLGQPRYNRNTLFMGRDDHSYSETALMAGIAATDWSWCPVFLDVDLDGYEDLLVTNGFSFDVMDQDSQDQLRIMQLSKFDRQRSRQFHPPFLTKNVSFKNLRNGTFEAVDGKWGFDIQGISYGMALADLDNDGDQDVVINQLNEAALILKNEATASRVKVTVEGPKNNYHGIGAHIRISNDLITQSQVILSGGRYLSSDETARTFACDLSNLPSQLEVTWPDQSVTTIQDIKPNHHYVVRYSGSSPGNQDHPVRQLSPLFTDESHLLKFKHQTSPALPIPQQNSDSMMEINAPGVCWMDINRDGWDDLFISGGQNQPPGIFINQKGLSFEPVQSKKQTGDALGSVVPWDDNKGNRYWLASASHRTSDPERSSAVHFYSASSTEPQHTLITGPAGIGTLCVADIDMDGDQDLFIGSTSVYGKHPEPAASQIWLNVNGNLTKSVKWSEPFESAGIVTGAVFFHFDKDGHPDLAIATEWGTIRAYQNTLNGFVEETESTGLFHYSGWWTCLGKGDFNQDGREDLVAGNIGLNTPKALYPTNQFRIWYGDLDNNGFTEAIETWHENGNWYPLANRTELSRIMPDLPQRFTTHRQFSDANIQAVTGNYFSKLGHHEAKIAESSLFLNLPSGFQRVKLPRIIQESPVYNISVADLNGDHIEDLFLGQNKYPENISITRLDNGNGVWLLGKGEGTFENLTQNQTGISLHGESRSSATNDYNQDGALDLIVVEKNAVTRVFKGNPSP